jgi:exopolyphosphatase/guanosine-5'-triphosphate,3'-diphosphate pyrophosphatase
VVPYRIKYDYQRTVEKIRSRGLPEAFAQMALQGKGLAAVLKNPESWEIPGLEDESWWIAPFKSLQNRQEDEDQRLDKISKIAAGYQCNLDHVQQAEHLALQLFDGLQPLHRLGPDERYWLRCASLLHDIGKPQGNKGHHKAALELILNDKNMPFGQQQRKIIGLIARYHRSAWPKEKHDQYISLPAVLQRKVTILSSILRVADGLDSPRRGNVIELDVKFSEDEITIKCLVNQQAKKEKKRALGKGELMEFAFDRDLYIEWHRM